MYLEMSIYIYISRHLCKESRGLWLRGLGNLMESPEFKNKGAIEII